MNRVYGTALLAALKGRDPPRVDVDELRERAAAGDAAARRTLRLAAALEELRHRVAQAVAWEAAPVLLADGSSLGVDEAERLLEAKEERRAHRPLRASVDDARRPFLQFYDRRSESVRALAWAAPTRDPAVPAPPPSRQAPAPPPGPPSTRDVLTAFLAGTGDLRDAARDALASVGGEALDDSPALARALDLPDAHGAFGAAATVALLAVARDARKPVRRIARFAAPRLLAGVVVDDGDLHFAQPARITRLERHWATLVAGAAALAVPDSHVEHAAGSSSPRDEEAALNDDDAEERDPGALWMARAFPFAAALSLAGAAARRSLETPRDVAEKAARAVAAAWVLRTRARIALAVLDDDARSDVDGARDALRAAFGVDPGRDLTRELSAPPFDVDTGDVGVALAHLLAVPLALSLRDAFDERFALVAGTWRERDAIEASAWAALSSSSSSLSALTSTWRSWLGEIV